MSQSKREQTFDELLDELDPEVYNKDPENDKIEAIPTGSMSLDISTGVGGIPLGKFTEIYGPESSGKTTLALSIARSALVKGMKVLFVEPENFLTKDLIKDMIGIDYDDKRLILFQPETAEQSLKLCEKGIKSKEFGLIILDSIGALAPEKEKEDDFGDAHVALTPRLLSAFLRRNAFAIRNNKVAVLFVNQIRDDIGSYMKAFSTPGGRAIKHFCAMMIQLSKIQNIEVGSADSKEIIGVLSKFTIKKNKLAPPYRSYTFPIIFGKGIDYLRDLVDFAENMGILIKKGSFYTFETEVIAQGMNKTIEKLETDKLLLDKIEKACYNIINHTERLEDKTNGEESITEETL